LLNLLGPTSFMKKFSTIVIGINNSTGQMGTWPGPIIEAASIEEADAWCKSNTQYLIVDQELIDLEYKTEGGMNMN